MLKELQAFKETITAPAHASFGGAGEHDDLVLAAALASGVAGQADRIETMTEGRVFRVIREPGDQRSSAELVAEQCDGAVLTESDLLIDR